MSELLSFLKNHQKEMEDTLLRLVEAESPSNNKVLADQCGVVLQKEFEALIGGSVEVVPQENVGNQYCFTYGTGEETEQILIIGHYDTVWNEGALPIKKEDGLLYGPGTFDMKGGLTTTLWALKALKEFGITGKKKIVFFVSSDEEIGSNYSRQRIEEEAIKSTIVYVPESSISPDAAVKTARKGVGWFTISVTGITGHAGIDPWSGVSAIDELALQMVDIKKLASKEEGISINVGMVLGGSRPNVIAKSASAEIDVRITTREQAEEVERKILDRAPFLDGTTVEVTGGINRYPLERDDKVVELYEQLKEIAACHGYDLKEGSSGGASDGNFTAGLGIPTIDGLGPQGDGAHADHEHVVLTNLPYRAALLAEALKLNMK
ncbi:M20 family metallopeptidase [Bacillus sp. 31A1R]|uniref:M20 family metallopeptidase n=1 Tax=Robertmurraya mangrovi TaxID=3098077 RepID=A0ABU5IW21_9BACI|nr:M20 family metallopeptidase [Bacillus sp. 31A1R]MDZ5471325.1 M20 family metallopeptidase [Bacillus sp. 31A1R]